MRRLLDIVLNVATVLIMVGAVLGFARSGSPLRSDIDSWRARRAVVKTWPILKQSASRLDSGTGEVSLVEFGDYECPFCKKAHENLGIMLRLHPDVGVAFRHYPLAIHPAAEGAARAAICGQEQGKFRELDEYFYTTEKWKTDRNWSGAARAVGVPDVAGFESCLKSRETTERLESDKALAERVGVRGTPSFFNRREIFLGASSDSALWRFANN